MLKRLLPKKPERIGLLVTYTVLFIGAPWAIEGLQEWIEHAMGTSTASGHRPWYAVWPAIEALAIWCMPAVFLGAATTWFVRRRHLGDPETSGDHVSPGHLTPSEARQELASSATDWALRGVGYVALVVGVVLLSLIHI